MKKRMLLWAPALIAIGCGGAAKNTKADDKPQASGGAACCTEAEAEAPPPKLHGPKKRVGIVDFDNASHPAATGAARATRSPRRRATRPPRRWSSRAPSSSSSASSWRRCCASRGSA